MPILCVGSVLAHSTVNLSLLESGTSTEEEGGFQVCRSSLSIPYALLITYPVGSTKAVPYRIG
ncbi:ORF981 [White spot syndrome virus]|uniref:Wsv326 n=3 Tax=White spot syndrome virus TaxID=342409 RepID=Q8VAR9_WSSVS|nr:wsv326 [Shrimp white spot syndrome virus]AFX59703.1 wsv326 [White spot syndrome virus]AAL33328.1 wsv326 [Shrimp white spot syndrome virus]AAL89250.1 WSSV382 [Shrimp white spot syndrome virus]ATU84169.1 ORF981 [White spot syndrome virus]AWQ60457.1 wsv326 [Shrimp white spot syndrome virus]